MVKNTVFRPLVKSRKKWSFLGYLLREKIPLVRKKGPKQGVTRGTQKSHFLTFFALFVSFLFFYNLFVNVIYRMLLIKVTVKLVKPRKGQK
jgi:hypothetical protein